MDSLSKETLSLLLLVFPGLLTLGIRRALAVTAKEGIFETTVSALFFTILDRAIYLPLSHWAWVQRLNPPPSGDSTFWREFSAQGGYPLLAVAALVGIILGVLRDRDWDYELLRRLGLTSRTAHADAWNEVLRRKNKVWVLVQLADGRRYLGWHQTYSDDPGIHEMLLADASPVDESGRVYTEQNKQILLLRDNAILSIEFLEDKEHDG